MLDNPLTPHAQLQESLNMYRRDACHCGLFRTVQITCSSAEQAEHLVELLLDPRTAPTIDASIVQAYGVLMFTPGQWHASQHREGLRTVRVKMTRVPFEVLPVGGEQDGDLPVDAWFLGLWLGDGAHASPSITVAGNELELLAKLRQLVADLNENKPSWAAPVHLHIYQYPEHGPHAHNVDVFQCSISSTVARADRRWWNPIVTGLRALGVYENRKIHGVPQAYLQGSERTRAAVLAGLIDSDGHKRTNANEYKFSQCAAHEAIVAGFRSLALGLGIRAHALIAYVARDHNGTQFPAVKVHIGGPNISKVQPFIVVPKKRLVNHALYDYDLRPIELERLDRPSMGRIIRARDPANVRGMPLRRQVIRGQLADGSIVRV
jgi:hypothetical protein